MVGAGRVRRHWRNAETHDRGRRCGRRRREESCAWGTTWHQIRRGDWRPPDLLPARPRLQMNFTAPSNRLLPPDQYRLISSSAATIDFARLRPAAGRTAMAQPQTPPLPVRQRPAGELVKNATTPHDPIGNWPVTELLRAVNSISDGVSNLITPRPSSTGLTEADRGRQLFQPEAGGRRSKRQLTDDEVGVPHRRGQPGMPRW